MNIKIGDYIRTSYGEIGKYLGKDIRFDMYDYDVNGNKSSCKYNELIKHSPNIIDLIEVGDYVNGYRILEIEDINNCNKKAFTIFKQNEHCYVRLWKTEDIKSIVTKELFKNSEYEV